MRASIQASLTDTFAQLEAQAMGVLPKLLAATLIVVVGVLAGFVIGRATKWILGARRFDRTVARLGLASSLEALGIASVVRTLATAARWLVILLASVTALGVLDARLAGELMRRLILYLPDLAVAAVILVAGWLAAGYLSRTVLIAAVNNELPRVRALGALTRCTVITMTVAMACEHLGIGRSTVLVAFGVLFGGMVLAASVAVGLGMQDVVRRWWLEDSADQRRKDQVAALRHW